MGFWNFLKTNNKTAGFTQPTQSSAEDNRVIGLMNYFKNAFSYETGSDWKTVETAATWPEGAEIAKFIKDLENNIRKNGRITAYAARFKKLAKLMKGIMPEFAPNMNLQQTNSQGSNSNNTTPHPIQPQQQATTGPQQPLQQPQQATGAWQQPQATTGPQQPLQPQQATGAWQQPEKLMQTMQIRLQQLDAKLAEVDQKEKKLEQLLQALAKVPGLENIMKSLPETTNILKDHYA